jgi:hypothetical protein
MTPAELELQDLALITEQIGGVTGLSIAQIDQINR